MLRWWRLYKLRRTMGRLLKDTNTHPDGTPFARNEPCSCATPW